MGHVNKVLRSVNLPGEAVCLDLFQRPDGTFGFDVFRRDPEDGRGWYVIGHFDHFEFDSYEVALEAACFHVRWLPDALDTAQPI